MKENKFRTLWANLIIVAVLVSTFGIAFFAASSPSFETKTVNNAVYEGNKESGGVSLMFNVYENAANVEKIAEILSSFNADATFFVGGSWVAKHQNTLLKLAASGFEIGNHGYLHRDHKNLSYADNISEITLAEKVIKGAINDFPYSYLFAPPSGSMGNDMFEACKNLNYTVIMWTRDTIDWRDHDANLIYERAVKNVKAGDLILMHPTDCTVEALPKIIEYIYSQNLKLNSVSEVIKGS